MKSIYRSVNNIPLGEITKRMVDGEVFYSKQGSVCYSYDPKPGCFVKTSIKCVAPMQSFNLDFYERIEQPWYEDPDFKLPCLMQNRLSGEYQMVVAVEGRFALKDKNSYFYKHNLTPVPRDVNGHYIIDKEKS